MDIKKIILQVYLKAAKALSKNQPVNSNRNIDTPEDQPGLSHLDENYMEKYAAKFRAELAAQANSANASPAHQSPTETPNSAGLSTGFGRCK